jgi:hypothetical protein
MEHLMYILKYVCALMIILGSLTYARPAGAAKYALLVGINDYSAGAYTSLDGCLNDVELMEQVLSKPQFGFLPHNITVLRNRPATHANVMRALEKLASLAKKDDTVYIHYSGHGSLACDLNGDERAGGKDSTLVTFGARTGAGDDASGVCPPPGKSVAHGPENPAPDINDFDILDDEINKALGKLTGVCDAVIFVADSCHSGTITRGDRSAKTRGITLDARPHPLGAQAPPPASSSRGWVGIGAAATAQKAVEYRDENGTAYGAFTWFWAKSLLQGAPQDTWLTVFNRAAALLKDAGYTQNPVIEGRAGSRIFSGEKGGAAAFSVMQVTEDGKKVIINAGALNGIGPGSVFAAGSARNPTTLLTVTESRPAECDAVPTSGTVKAGDAVTLKEWAAPDFVLKFFISPVRGQDAPYIEHIRKMLSDLPVYAEVGQLEKADMLFWLLRPQKNSSGGYVSEQNSVLPRTDPTAAPELWVTSPGETMLAGGKNLRASLTREGLDTLRVNLERFARKQAVLNMPMPGGGNAPVQFIYHIYAPCSDREWNGQADDARIDLGRNGKWKRTRIVPADGQDCSLKDGEKLIFVEARNRTQKEYYVYGLNVTGNAAVISFLPPSSHILDTKVPPMKSVLFTDSALLLEEPEEYVRLMASLNAIDTSRLEQAAMSATRGDAGTATGVNPVERFLSAQFGASRGIKASTACDPEGWGTVKTTFMKGK